MVSCVVSRTHGLPHAGGLHGHHGTAHAAVLVHLRSPLAHTTAEFDSGPGLANLALRFDGLFGPGVWASLHPFNLALALAAHCLRALDSIPRHPMTAFAISASTSATVFGLGLMCSDAAKEHTLYQPEGSGVHVASAFLEVHVSIVCGWHAATTPACFPRLCFRLLSRNLARHTANNRGPRKIVEFRQHLYLPSYPSSPADSDFAQRKFLEGNVSDMPERLRAGADMMPGEHPALIARLICFSDTD